MMKKHLLAQHILQTFISLIEEHTTFFNPKGFDSEMFFARVF